MRLEYAMEHPCRDCHISIEGFDQDRHETIRTLMRAVMPIVPPWCCSLKVGRLPDQEDHVADIRCMPEYRAAHVSLHPQFFDKPHEDRIRTLVHEFVHLATSPLVEPLMQLARIAMKKSDPLHDYHTDHLRRLEETVTEDLAVMLSNLLQLPRRESPPSAPPTSDVRPSDPKPQAPSPSPVVQSPAQGAA